MDLGDVVWRKSSFSGTQSDCVEMAWSQAVLAVRDSKNTDGPVLLFPRSSVAALVDGLAAGRHTVD